MKNDLMNKSLKELIDIIIKEKITFTIRNYQELRKILIKIIEEYQND